MNLEQITALAIAVGSIITALGALINHLGNKKKIKYDAKKDTVDEWREISSNYKKNYLELSDRFDELEELVKQTNHQHQLEIDEWRAEQQKLIDENVELTERVSVLEEALTHEGVDVTSL